MCYIINGSEHEMGGERWRDKWREGWVSEWVSENSSIDIVSTFSTIF